jgi:class 3 adenylate cyclase
LSVRWRYRRGWTLRTCARVISAYQKFVAEKCVAETVQRFSRFVAKYIGVLVYFGYPQAREEDAERAARAGLELVQAVGSLKSGVPLPTPVGIATGLTERKPEREPIDESPIASLRQ